MQTKLEMLCKEAELGATKLNWEPTIVAFKSIFTNLPASGVSSLAVATVKLYLPRFLDKNPQEIWVNQRLETINQVLSDEMDAENISGYPDYTKTLNDPLARGFNSAIGSLWRMVKMRSNFDQFNASAINAISVTFTLLRYEYPAWLPAEYEYMRAEGKSSIQYQVDLWCDLARKLGDIVLPDESSKSD